MENIGAKIKELRILKGLTQEELAEQTGLSVRTIQRIESGDVDPRTYTLTALASALDVDLEIFTSKKIGLSEQEQKNQFYWIILLHISGLFVLVLPPLLIWIFKRDEIPEMNKHAKDVINFQISIFIYLMISAMLIIIFIGLPMLMFLGLFSQIVIVINTIKVMNHQAYNYPWSLKILK